MPATLPSCRLPSMVLFTALGSAVALGGCRTTEDARVVPAATVERSVDHSATVRTERIPGGRPGGIGDPRRYPLAQGREARRTVDPAGSYDLSFTDDGKVMAGSMVIAGAPGEFTGRITAEARPEVRISTVTASGPLVTVTGDVPNGVLLLRFRMTGDSLHGDWSLRNDGGRLVGARRPDVRRP